MSIFNKSKNAKFKNVASESLINSPYLSDNLDISKLLSFIKEEASHSFRYLKGSYDEPKIIEDSDDFYGRPIGEICIKMKDGSMDKIEPIHYTDEKDLNKKIIEYLLNISAAKIEIDKNDIIPKILYQAADACMDRTCRGGANVIVCTSTFLEKHPNMSGMTNDYTILVVEDLLPDNMAITNYVPDKEDISILACLDDISKTIKLMPINNYVTTIVEK